MTEEYSPETEEHAPEREDKAVIRIYIPASEVPKLEKLIKQAVALRQIELKGRDKEGYSTFFNWALAVANNYLKEVYKHARGMR